MCSHLTRSWKQAEGNAGNCGKDGISGVIWVLARLLAEHWQGLVHMLQRVFDCPLVALGMYKRLTGENWKWQGKPFYFHQRSLVKPVFFSVFWYKFHNATCSGQEWQQECFRIYFFLCVSFSCVSHFLLLATFLIFCCFTVALKAYCPAEFTSNIDQIHRNKLLKGCFYFIIPCLMHYSLHYSTNAINHDCFSLQEQGWRPLL